MISSGFFESIYQFLSSHVAFVSFFGILCFGGETAALLGFGAAQGSYPLWIVMVFGFLGIVIADIGWYAIGKYSLLDFLKKHHLINFSSRKAEKLLGRLYKKKIKLMFFSRFIYGTAIVTFIYLGKRMKFSEFIFYESIISFFWLLFYLGIGWYAGKGFRFLMVVYNNIWFVGFFIILLVLVVVAFNFLINSLLLRGVRKR